MMNLLEVLHTVITMSCLKYNASHILRGFRETRPHTQDLESLAQYINVISFKDLDLNILAGQLLLYTTISFSECVEKYYMVNDLLSSEFKSFTRRNAMALERMIDLERNRRYGYVAAKHFCMLYTLPGENPQYMFMRASIATHLRSGGCLKNIEEMYCAISTSKISLATPILSKSGFIKNQTSSCFVGEIDDSFSNIRDFVDITNNHGGIGVSVSRVSREMMRPTLEILNGISKHQMTPRKNAITVFCDVSHISIEIIIDGRKPNLYDNRQINNLFYGIWVPDLFMKRVEMGGVWTLFENVAITSELLDLFGDEYDALYTKYEADPKIKKRTTSAIDIWDRIVRAQAETGTPFVMFKDSINKKNAQSNLGVITGSNLCTEIMQVFSSESMAVCNLGSLVLSNFVVVNPLHPHLYTIDYRDLQRHAGLLVRYLNYILDASYMGDRQTNNLTTRPIGIGVLGLATMFQKLMLPFTSCYAQNINKDVFETIYYGALMESCVMSRGTTSYFLNSPASKGILQFDLWGKEASGKLNWGMLKSIIKRYGLSNSVLCAIMPTATTSLIQECSESVDPIIENAYVRNTSGGSFTFINHCLIETLKKDGLWDENFVQRLIQNGGSIQNMNLPALYKDVFKGVWEMSTDELSTLINMSADRGIFIDQSQSTSLYSDSIENITPLLFSAWKRGLKGIYYVRVKPLDRLVDHTTSIACNSCSL